MDPTTPDRGLLVETNNERRSGMSDDEADAGWMTIRDALPLTVEMVTLRLDGHCRLKLPVTYPCKRPLFLSVLRLFYLDLRMPHY